MPEHNTPARADRIGIGVGWFTPRRRRWLMYATSGDHHAATPDTPAAARPSEPRQTAAGGQPSRPFRSGEPATPVNQVPAPAP